MFQYVWDIYIFGLKMYVPISLLLSIVTMPELDTEYIFGYISTGLCIGYIYPISFPFPSFHFPFSLFYVE